MLFATLREDLMALPKASILDMFGKLNGTGKPGFDHERAKKSECVDMLIRDFPADVIDTSMRGLPPMVAAAPKAAPAAPAVDQSAIAQQIGGLFAALAGSAVNEPRVIEIVNGAVKAALERTPIVQIVVKRPDESTYKVPGHVRAEFQKVLRRAGAGINVLLVGPAGCGKTHLAHQVADALGRPFASISCTAGMSESALTGWMLPGNGGAFEYTPSDFVTMYENGGVFLFDEIDAADPNTLLFVNQALANGSFYVPQRKGYSKVIRHANFVCLAAANTFGTGANMVYAGRERLDESTLDRFRAGTVMLDYDAAFERAAVAPELLAWGWAVRKRIGESRLSRVMSTRFLLDASKLLAAGETFNDVKESYFTGWKVDEKNKVEV